MHAQDKAGCPVSHVFDLEITAPPMLNFPTGFSPNGAGINDWFYLESTTLTQLEASIYDRSGNLVFQASQPGFRWDGTSLNGSLCAPGVYVLVLKGVEANGNAIERRESLTLIR